MHGCAGLLEGSLGVDIGSLIVCNEGPHRATDWAVLVHTLLVVAQELTRIHAVAVCAVWVRALEDVAPQLLA